MKKLLTLLSILLLLYAAIGFYYLPGVIQMAITEQIKKQTGHRLELENVSFNPFTFTLELEQPTVHDSNDRIWLTLKNGSLNINAWDLLFGKYTISQLTIDQPVVTLYWDDNGQLTVPAVVMTHQNTPSEPPKLSVVRSDILDGQLHITLAGQNATPLIVSGIDVALIDFNLNQGEAVWTMAASTKQTTQWKASGSFDSVNQVLQAEWDVQNLQLADWTEHITLPLDDLQGLLALNGTLDWSLQQQPVVHLGVLEAQDLAFQAPPFFKVSQIVLQAEDWHMDLNSQTLEGKLLATEQGQITWLNTKDNNTRVEEQANPWQFQLDHLIAYQTTVNLPEQWLQGPLLLDSLKGQHIGNSQSTASQWEATVLSGPSGQLRIQAEQTQQPWAIQGTLNMIEWPLPTINPTLFPEQNFSIQKGLFNTDQAFMWQADHWQTTGAWQINDFALLDGSGLTVAEWPALTSSGGGVNGSSQTIYLGDLNSDQAQGFIPLVSDGIQEPHNTDESSANWRIKLGPFR